MTFDERSAQEDISLLLKTGSLDSRATLDLPKHPKTSFFSSESGWVGQKSGYTLWIWEAF